MRAKRISIMEVSPRIDGGRRPASGGLSPFAEIDSASQRQFAELIDASLVSEVLEHPLPGAATHLLRRVWIRKQPRQPGELENVIRNAESSRVVHELYPVALPAHERCQRFQV